MVVGLLCVPSPPSVFVRWSTRSYEEHIFMNSIGRLQGHSVAQEEMIYDWILVAIRSLVDTLYPGFYH